MSLKLVIDMDHLNLQLNIVSLWATYKKVSFRINESVYFQDLHSATVKRYDDTLGRITDFTKKRDKYRDASEKMEKTVEDMPEVIEELQ